MAYSKGWIQPYSTGYRKSHVFGLVFANHMGGEQCSFLNSIGRASMTESPDNNKPLAAGVPGSWGKKLFLGTLIALLVFFYWLLVYSGGVTVHHG